MPRSDHEPTTRPTGSKLHQITVPKVAARGDFLAIYEGPVATPIISNSECFIVIQEGGVLG